MGIKEDLELVKKFQKEIHLLGQAYALLKWDQQTYMPKKASVSRAEQLSLLDSIIHEKKTSEEFFQAVKRLQKEDLGENDKIMIKHLYKDLSKAHKLPKDFIEELSRATALGFDAWIDSKEKKDFEIFRPFLEKIVSLKQKETALIAIGDHPCDSLLDSYEEGMTVKELKEKFEKLKIGILKILRKIKNSEKYKNQKIILRNKSFSHDKQISLAKEVSKKIGLHSDFSRIDFAEHPYTLTIGENDIRITTNIRENPLFSFESTIHESGHGLYEKNLPEEHKYTVLKDSPSYGIHESQSRFWEIMIGRSKDFWDYYFKKFNEFFDIKDFNQWFFEINHIRPGKIRIESDELHYHLHIILRFEIELGLIEGTLDVSELPKVWNKKMEEYFGIAPEHDSEGVLQDVHWSQGSFGYFPSYALGTIYAFQLFNVLKNKFPEISEDMKNGDYSKIKDWLKENVHIHGKKFLAEELIKKICGKGLDVDSYLDYLDKKYSEIYNL
jgi:carboxypeptidase Taq